MEYLKAVYIPILTLVIWLLIVGILAFVVKKTDAIAIMVVVFYLSILVAIPFINGRIFITTWNNTLLSNSQFQTSCGAIQFAWIIISNWIVRACTLGLMSPWAAIRIHKYKVESLSLLLLDDPNEMVNLAQADFSAVAEEISDIFDLDISL